MMRRVILWLAIVGLGLMVASSDGAAAPSAPPGPDKKPVVRAVLFWMDSCPHCHYVIDDVLPPLQQKYGDQLEILMVEVTDEQKWHLLEQTAAALGVPGPYGVPFLVIGDRVLIGSVEIPAQLPGLIEKHLAAGGVDYPRLEVLAGILPTPAPASAYEGTSPAAQPRFSGLTLATAVLLGMIAALIYTVVTVARGFQGAPAYRLPPRLELATPLLSVVGLGVALYLSYVELQAAPAVCGPVGDCNAVQSSPYARLFGVLPVGMLGAGGYLAIFVAWLWGRFRSDPLAAHAPLALFGMALFGTLFSAYLTYIEVFVLRAVCIWCLISAVLMTLLLLLGLGPALESVRTGEEISASEGSATP
jgi:uncharacterized membrane protein/thiol-disulfide isomerase/thioredoxin